MLEVAEQMKATVHSHGSCPQDAQARIPGNHSSHPPVATDLAVYRVYVVVEPEIGAQQRFRCVWGETAGDGGLPVFQSVGYLSEVQQTVAEDARVPRIFQPPPAVSLPALQAFGQIERLVND